MDIKIPVEFPSIDLSAVLPIIALVILAALILVTLTARSLIQSRALALVALAAIIIGGSSSIVGGLQAIAGLILVTGLVAIGLIVTLGRHREVLDVVRIVVERPTIVYRQEQPRTQLLDAPPQTYQLPAASQTTTPRRRAASTITLPKDWGF
jgi:hypothetical protein